jgi:2,3-dihydroxy-2,3-dihydrophenylpropionate dehydrogenase
MGWLEGCSALITAGGSGLGSALVERFVDEGARVGVLEVHPDKAAVLRRQYGDHIVVTQGSATSPADNERAVADVAHQYGHLDTFVGNAGLSDFGKALEETDIQALPEAFSQLFGLNVLGYILGAKASMSALKRTRGSMIFTLSNAAFWPGGGGPLYTASKHAGVGLIKQLAYELAPDVRVNGVAPGGMSSDLRGPIALGQKGDRISDLPIDQLMINLGPLERAMEPADFTGTYVLLALKENSSTTTGSIHNCDGGIGRPWPKGRSCRPSRSCAGRMTSRH